MSDSDSYTASYRGAGPGRTVEAERSVAERNNHEGDFAKDARFDAEGTSEPESVTSRNESLELQAEKERTIK